MCFKITRLAYLVVCCYGVRRPTVDRYCKLITACHLVSCRPIRKIRTAKLQACTPAGRRHGINSVAVSVSVSVENGRKLVAPSCLIDHCNLPIVTAVQRALTAHCGDNYALIETNISTE